MSRGLSRGRGLMLMQKTGNMFIADAMNYGHGVGGGAEETTASEQSEEGGGSGWAAHGVPFGLYFKCCG